MAKVLNVYRGDGLNLYAYVKNNPIMWVDPSGYMAHPDKDTFDEFDILPYDNKKYKTPGKEKHHGILNEWAEKNIPGYKKRNSPTVLLSEESHEKTKKVYREWLRLNYDKPVGVSPDWTKISRDEITKLANDMFDAASVPKNVRDEYFDLFDIFIMEVL